MSAFLEKYVALTGYCERPGLDPGVFRLFHDEYAKAWQRLDYQQQGEVAALISQHYGEMR